MKVKHIMKYLEKCNQEQEMVLLSKYEYEKIFGVYSTLQNVLDGIEVKNIIISEDFKNAD